MVWLKHKVHIIYAIIILCILCGGLFGFNIKSRSYQKLHDEKIKSEERIKFYEQDAKNQKYISDSLRTNARALEAVIEYQKSNPKIIVEKYNDIRGAIKSLNADETISYLSTALSKEGGHR